MWKGPPNSVSGTKSSPKRRWPNRRFQMCIRDRNYAVDGVQYDDYFYPPGGVPDDNPADFEAEDFARSGMSDIGQWRRTHVSALVLSLIHI